MNVFVTGGAGYIGSHCVKRLLDARHEVTVYDSLINGHRAAVDPRATFVQGDLADREKLHGVLAAGGFDATLHFAAFLNVSESVEKPLLYYRNNVANTINLLEGLQRARIQRLVFSGTCAVYGVPETLPITEDARKRPISPYGTSKLTVEWLLRDSAEAWGLGSVTLRYFNAAGAAADGTLGEDHRPEIHLIPALLEVALGKRESVQVFGTDYPTPDGSCVRDFIHVDDLAEAHLLAMEQLTPELAEAYNVGTGRGHSVLEVLTAARAVTGEPIPHVVAERRAGDPPQLYADATRIRRRFGWESRFTDLSDMIASAWRWRQAHPDGYGPE
jgi:UDP-glucose 4-epimerase